jgi:hypothetical protein
MGQAEQMEHGSTRALPAPAPAPGHHNANATLATAAALASTVPTTSSVMEEAFIDIDHRALSDQRCEIPTRSGRHQGAIRGNHRAIVGNQLQSEAIRGRFVT